MPTTHCLPGCSVADDVAPEGWGRSRLPALRSGVSPTKDGRGAFISVQVRTAGTRQERKRAMALGSAWPGIARSCPGPGALSTAEARGRAGADLKCKRNRGATRAGRMPGTATGQLTTESARELL
jgi:hypothetical protein